MQLAPFFLLTWIFCNNLLKSLFHEVIQIVQIRSILILNPIKWYSLLYRQQSPLNHPTVHRLGLLLLWISLTGQYAFMQKFFENAANWSLILEKTTQNENWTLVYHQAVAYNFCNSSHATWDFWNIQSRLFFVLKYEIDWWQINRYSAWCMVNGFLSMLHLKAHDKW